MSTFAMRIDNNGEGRIIGGRSAMVFRVVEEERTRGRLITREERRPILRPIPGRIAMRETDRNAAGKGANAALSILGLAAMFAAHELSSPPAMWPAPPSLILIKARLPQLPNHLIPRRPPFPQPSSDLRPAARACRVASEMHLKWPVEMV
jgi:hypothetical protein